MPATPPSPSSNRRSESGAIAILVAIMLLVFITLVAVGMSRNAVREAILSGTAREGAMSDNVADSGLEWALYWMTQNNEPSAASTSAQQLAGPQTGLLTYLLANNQASGQYYNLDQTLYSSTASNTPPADLTVSGTPAGVTSGFHIAVMRMGQLQGGDSSVGAYGSAPGPNLWAIRSDGHVTTGPVTFVHSKEAWVTTPSQ